MTNEPSPRRALIAVGVVALTVVGAVVLFVALRPTVSWSERVALAETPDGFTLALVYGSSDLDDAGGEGRAVLYTEAGAEYRAGRWLAVAAVPIDPTAPVDPESEFPGEDRTATEIGGVPAAVGITFDGRPGVVLGPIDGYVVSLVGHDVTAIELTDWASDVTISDGVPVAAGVPGMRRVADSDHATVDAVTSLVSASVAAGEGSALVSYQPDEGTTPLQVSNRAVTDDRRTLVRFFLGDSPSTDVGGADAWANSLTVADYTVNVLAFERSGRLITLSSERGTGELAAWAAGIVELSQADWDQLATDAQAFFDN